MKLLDYLYYTPIKQFDSSAQLELEMILNLIKKLKFHKYFDNF